MKKKKKIYKTSVCRVAKKPGIVEILKKPEKPNILNNFTLNGKIRFCTKNVSL